MGVEVVEQWGYGLGWGSEGGGRWEGEAVGLGKV